MNTTTDLTKGLTYGQAMAALDSGKAVRLPEWTGYWFNDGKTLGAFTRTGDIVEPWLGDMSVITRNDWQLVTEGLGFDFAILALKAGKSVRKSAWAADVFLTMQVPDEHSKMTAPYIFVTSRFGNVPGVITQTEMLSTDWEVVK